MVVIAAQALIGLACFAVARPAAAADDGRRAVEAVEYGIAVRAPQAWSLIHWADEDSAFVLRLPQEKGSRRGFVDCRLALSAPSLKQLQAAQQEASQAKPPAAEAGESPIKRILVSNSLEELDGHRFERQRALGITQRLVTLWEERDGETIKTFELVNRLVSNEILYTFTLRSDEAHFDAYRLDFDELLSSARFTQPTVGLQPLPGGIWLQRQHHFAIWLPAGWQPEFGPRGKNLLTAAGGPPPDVHQSLIVVGLAAQPLDLEALRASLAKAISERDPQARVVRCQVVPQGTRRALEIEIHTRRGERQVVLLERHFAGERRNYELRCLCPADAFGEQAAGLRRALDSFRELDPQAARGVL